MLENVQTFELEKPTFILIDGSYFCFYRYYSLLKWWKIAFPLEPLENPLNNPVFVEKYKKTFIDCVKNLPSKLLLGKTSIDNKNIHLFAAKDCKRENIWRNELFSKYKGTRIYDEKFLGGPFFKMAYKDSESGVKTDLESEPESESESLFLQAGIKQILSLDKLEADDCIAITVKQIKEKFKEDCMIYIIASDHDYLQLHSDNVKIFNLAYKNIAESKTVTGIAEADLEIKIIMGDSSDNIPSVFPKCGFKTAYKCFQDKLFFDKKMDKNEVYYNQYNLNKKIIDFQNIPKDLEEQFLLKNSLFV
jgi:5'-3' exonuclease